MGKIKKFFRYDNVGIIFVLPAFIYMLVFVGYSIVQNIILSMQDVTAANLVRGSKNFVMFENYAALFHDDIFLKSLGNTLYGTLPDIPVSDRLCFGAVFQQALCFGEIDPRNTACSVDDTGDSNGADV